jgi:DNA sulfur modification protein DndD
MVNEISINIQTFIVSIKDSQGRIIEKHNLSSGLKQVFAFSLLWGLTLVSKIEIPIIIDTPFGRLDSVHRTNILQNYYPNAGRQVIVLSTDTEIDQKNAQLLQHHIERSYLLERKSELEAVQIKRNYF